MTALLTRRRALAGGTGLIAAGMSAGYFLTPEKTYPSALPAALLKEDLDFWRNEVLQRHPRFAGQTMLDPATERAFRDAAAKIDGSLSRQDAFRIFAAINPYFRDAHTLIMPWTSGAEPNEEERAVQFPFGIDILPDMRMRLRSSWHNARTGMVLPEGSQILAINGISTPTLINQLAQYGHGETALLRAHMLALMLPEWFDAILAWRGRFSIAAYSATGRSNFNWSPESGWALLKKGTPTDLPTLSWPRSDVAMLHVPTFDVDEAPEVFEHAIDDAFANIRSGNARQLIIDVRGNTGGQSDAAAQIVRYFLKRPVVQVARARERLNSDNNGFLGYRGAPGSMREFDLSEDQIEPAEAALRFTGPVTVLIDEMTYSAGILFATTMQDHGLAILAGKPTGGFANQTGNMMPSRLPHTGFTAFIATREFVRPSGDLRKVPVMPDLRIVGDPTDDDLVAMIETATERSSPASSNF